MDLMNRRDFLSRTAAVVGASIAAEIVADSPTTQPVATQPAGKSILRATDQIVLGKTGIKASRLAIGTGTKGASEQQRVGQEVMVDLFRANLERGIRWWDVADMYRTHPYVKEALKGVKRERVTITTKIWCRDKDADAAQADLERFRKEMDTDYLDVVLLHCLEDARWPKKLKGIMDVLSEAKSKGQVRAMGCSCHSMEALQAAVDEPWVEVVLARINPFAAAMDVKEAEQVPKVEAVLRALAERGKVVYGMKIFGEGQIKGDRIDESLRFALTRPYLSAFTIGFSARQQVDDVVRRIERLQVSA